MTSLTDLGRLARRIRERKFMDEEDEETRMEISSQEAPMQLDVMDEEDEESRMEISSEETPMQLDDVGRNALATGSKTFENTLTYTLGL
jgi:hypothetical protein